MAPVAMARLQPSLLRSAGMELGKFMEPALSGAHGAWLETCCEILHKGNSWDFHELQIMGV